MFYTFSKLRKSNRLLLPKGPSLLKKPIKINICGTQLSFKSPKIKISPFSSPKETYNLSGLGFWDGYFEALSETEKKHKCGAANIYNQSWNFNGPWFTGNLATFFMKLSVIKLERYSANVSAFHPRSLEKIIDDDLTTYYSQTCDFMGNIQEYNAPLNWKPLKHLPVNAAQFSVERTLTNLPGGGLQHYVFIPIEDRLIVIFSFYESRHGLLPTCALDKLTSREPIQALIDNIISSIDIQLSPEAKVQQERALEGLEDTSLVTDYPPIKWDNLDDETRAQILEQDERDRIAEYGC